MSVSFAGRSITNNPWDSFRDAMGIQLECKCTSSLDALLECKILSIRLLNLAGESGIPEEDLLC